MKLFSTPQQVPADFGPSAVTIGKFDGLHRGHRAVIDRMRQLAADRGLRSVVVTFDRNPLSLLRPESCPPQLTSPAQKLELLAGTGVDATLMLAFDEKLAGLSAEQFVETVLAGGLRAEALLVGADFRFGARGAGDVALLSVLGAQYGFEVIVIDDVMVDDSADDTAEGRADDAEASDHRLSATRIRQLIADGDVAQAGRLLGRAPSVRSTVVRGQRRGHELGFPTANLDPAGLEGMIPADGVYAGWLTVDGVDYPAAISVGDNPTFEGVPARQVEAFALDQDFDLYGKQAEVTFVERIRGMERFEGVEALIAQMHDDVARTRSILR